jgi:hypothetical protein
MFDDIKEEEAADILPPEHHESVRLRRITSDIVNAAERTLAPVQRDEQLLDDRWITKRRRNQVKTRVAPPMTMHLDGLDWEVIVVKNTQVNAMCVPGGKIIVYTGFLDYFKTDAEVAAVLGHEVLLDHFIHRNPLCFGPLGWVSLGSKLKLLSTSFAGRARYCKAHGRGGQQEAVVHVHGNWHPAVL